MNQPYKKDILHYHQELINQLIEIDILVIFIQETKTLKIMTHNQEILSIGKYINRRNTFAKEEKECVFEREIKSK